MDEHPVLGRVVSHSGGYPGFGSNMCWHPASGTGVIALGNSTYSAMTPLAVRLRMAAVWVGPCRAGVCKAGDGTASVTVELVGEHATLTMTLVVDPETGLLRLADITP